MRAVEGSTIEAATGTTGGIIATNELNSRARAYITESDIDATSGDVTVNAFNLAVLDATTLSKATTSGEAISVVVAFNSVGFDGSNILFQAIDAILGSDYLIEQEPVGAQAFIENSEIDAGGDVTVKAETSEKLFDLDQSVITAQLLDDMSETEVLDEDDQAQDAASREALKTQFAGQGIEFDGELTVETIAVQSRWYVSDEAGRNWLVSVNPDSDALEVSLVNLLDARVGNDSISSVTNDRALFDAFIEGSKPDNAGKGIKDLKYGANGSSAGGFGIRISVSSSLL